MPQRLKILLLWLGIMTLGAYLRFHDLEQRPIHADEATGARILAQKLEGHGYTFNATHFHGPILSLSTVPLARLRHESTWPELSLTTLRIGPAIAGCLLILTPLLWVRYLGTPTALLAAALLATSPLLVYYNRMYIHETWLCLFGMWALNLGYRNLLNPRPIKAVLCGLSIGLMFATKETFAISLIAWSLAAASFLLNRTYGWNTNGRTAPLKNYLKPCIIIGLVAFAVGCIAYTDALRHPQGIIDALRTYFVYETTPGHEKAFTDYLHLLLWPKHQLGIWWSEASIALLGILTCLWAFWRRSELSTIIFLGVATLAHILIYSCISYKTPWLMLLPWAHACLLAASVLRHWQRCSYPQRTIATALIALTLGYQTYQSIQATGRLSNDQRNPYAYVPTTKDANSIRNWLLELSQQSAPQSIEPIAVIGSEYWPLPWFLRDFKQVGYWPAPNDNLTEFPIVFAMPEHTTICEDLLQDTHTALPRGLRSNVPIVLFLQNDLWQQWLNHP